MGETVPLKIVQGSRDKEHTQNDDVSIHVPSPCKTQHHRKLAIASIICGLSCIGIIALISSVKASKERDQKKAVEYSNRARKCAIISIVAWVAILVLTPVMMALVSYLLTLID